MRLQDLHTHSRFDDGANTLEEMVCAAAGKGLDAIGLSGHSPIPGETAWTMPQERLSEYLAQARMLKEKYRTVIPIFCGIEYDLRSQVDFSEFDYVIGSCHITSSPAGAFDADNTAIIAQEGVSRCFGGDADAAAEQYYSQYAQMAAIPEISIVAHFDLLTKFDEQTHIYDANSSRYLQAAYAAMDCLHRADKIFEVNTGAISRGYRTQPYPAQNLLRRLCAIGGRVCLSSDAHSTSAVGFAFDRALALIQECGFSKIWQLGEEGFMPVTLDL